MLSREPKTPSIKSLSLSLPSHLITPVISGWRGCVVSIGNVLDDLCVGAHVAQNIRNGGGLCRAYHIVRTVVETALYFV